MSRYSKPCSLEMYDILAGVIFSQSVISKYRRDDNLERWRRPISVTSVSRILRTSMFRNIDIENKLPSVMDVWLRLRSTRFSKFFPEVKLNSANEWTNSNWVEIKSSKSEPNMRIRD